MGPKKRMKLANISKHFVVCFVTDLFLYIILIILNVDLSVAVICLLFVALGVSCEYYHAGLSNKERRRVHHLFIRDEIQVSALILKHSGV